MASEIGVSQLAGSIPDFVQKKALDARYDKAVIAKNVWNEFGEMLDRGDRVSLSIMPSVSISTVGTGGSVTNQQLSVTAVEVIVDTWVETTVEVDDRAKRQSALNILSDFGRAFGQALAQEQDATLAGQHTNMTTYTVGGAAVGNATPLEDGMIRLARLKFDKNTSGVNGTGSIPENDRMWFLSPDAEADLLAIDRFVLAQQTGFSKGLQVEKGRISGLYGDPVYKTNQIKTSSPVRKNLFLHKEGLAIATQRNMKLTVLAKTQLSERITMDCLYGTKVVRADHCVVVNSAVNTLG